MCTDLDPDRDDPAVREQMAAVLVSAFDNSEGEGAFRFLQELRDLSRAYPDDAAVREQMAVALFMACRDADGGDSSGFLQELRDMHHAHTDDPNVFRLMVRAPGGMQDRPG